MADETTTTPATQKARNQATVPTPPRLSGDYASDSVAIRDWMSQFYQGAVVQSGLLDPNYQSKSAEIDPDNLPDPTDTTIAQAQFTANEAYTKARANETEIARIAPLLSGEFTIDGSNNQITFTYAEPFEVDDYFIMVQARDFTGTPAASAFVVTRIEKSKEDFVLTTAAAPGTSNGVTFDFYLFPNLNTEDADG